MLVPPQVRIMLLLEPKLIKEVRHSHVRDQKGKEIRASRKDIQKDVSRFLGILNATLRKEISRIFCPTKFVRGKICLCKEVHQWLMVCMYNKLFSM